MRQHFIHTALLCCLCTLFLNATAQERLAPLNYNPVLNYKPVAGSVGAGVPLQLPVFEDFTGDSPYPNKALWADQEVYINNTMCANPISRGVATFDALNQNGLPYNPNNPGAVVYADSLTSQPIDFTNYQPSDSIYLSFFYQPQGLGFSPETSDSLTLYLKKDSGWVQVWAMAGTTVQPFKQVMIPVRDQAFFHINFQFRFVNKASINLNDDVWNVDYIRLAANRNINDTLINDIAYTTTPTYMLNDYTYMPYHQFKANENGERAAQHAAFFQNNYATPQSVNFGYSAFEEISGTPLTSGASSSATVNAGQQQQCTFPVYTNTVPQPPRYNAVNFINKFYLESPFGDNNRANDTVTRVQVFHNYLAYDDGTAEKSYFLDLFATLPGKVAIDFHLNEPDTLSGIAIYFGRQAPMAYNKDFSVAVYNNIDLAGGGSDQLVYQEDFLFPGYLNINNFYYYKFKNRVPMPAGKFYLGVIQPALGVSDSLYYGFDVNRVGATHTYYNVLAKWEPSTIPGALMIRPVLGPIIPSDVPGVGGKPIDFLFYPNPATDRIQFGIDSPAEYDIYDVQGKKIQHGNIRDGEEIDISKLKAGIYFVRITANGMASAPKKLLKL